MIAPKIQIQIIKSKIEQMTIKEYIQNKDIKHFTWSGISITIKEPFTNDVSIKKILAILGDKVPRQLFQNIDSIYIGQFAFLKDKKMQAAYENSSIFLTNEQSSEEDALDDLIHEIAHSVEETYGNVIYSDSLLEREFLDKRKNLWLLLKSEGLNLDMELMDFLEVEYNEKFDMYLYQEVGYPMLAAISANLYYSPYGITSLREYFANGFEAFFYHRDIKRLESISPILYKKIIEIMEIIEE